MASTANGRKADISLLSQSPPKASTLPPDPTAPFTAKTAAAPVIPHASNGKAEAANAIAMQRFGEIASVLMGSAQHRKLTLADLEGLIMPALTTGQFMIAEGQLKATGIKQPVAAVMWARVSPEVDARLEKHPDQPIKLQANEWTSGDVIWIVEAVGEGQVLEMVMKRLVATAWAGKRVRLRVRGKDGKNGVGELRSKAAAGSQVN